MIDMLPGLIDRVTIALWGGIVLGVLFAIARRLLLIWGVLAEIERNTRYKR